MPLNTSMPAAPETENLDVVLTHTEAALLLRISTRTFDRLYEIGEAPPRIQLSERRVGYWRLDILAWLKARTSPARRVA